MSINYPNVLGRIESALGVAAPRDDNGERALAAIEQLKIAHGVSYENGQRLARMVGEQRDTIAQLTAELARRPFPSELRALASQDFIEQRGVEDPCENCRGMGTCGYSDTSTWRRRPSGQMMTTDVCDQCWGSGDEHRPGADLRKLTDELEAMRKERDGLADSLRTCVAAARYYEREKPGWCPNDDAHDDAIGAAEALLRPAPDGAEHCPRCREPLTRAVHRCGWPDGDAPETPAPAEQPKCGACGGTGHTPRAGFLLVLDDCRACDGTGRTAAPRAELRAPRPAPDGAEGGG